MNALTDRSVRPITEPDFLLAFWAPFTPTAGWDAHRVLAQKKADIEEAGFALWTFDRRPGMIPQWQAEIRRMGGGSVPVYGGGPVEPGPSHGPRSDARYWLPYLSGEPQPLPRSVSARHPGEVNDRGQLASAFVVESITIPEQPLSIDATPVEWWKKDEGFVTSPGTSGEVLVRPASREGVDLLTDPSNRASDKLLGGRDGGPVHFVLTLREPWVTLVGNANLRWG